MIDLHNKVILVTGGSRGIGAATVLTLAQAGAYVILHYSRARSSAQAIAQEIGSDRCYLVQADLAVANASHKLWQEAIAWRGRIDVLVNNAGIIQSAGIDDEMWDSAWQTTLQVNLIAAADLCREAIKHFRDRAGGIIINVASRAAFRGDAPDYMHYAASKGGVIALTRSIARGFAADNILAFAVAPGFVKTEMADEVIQTYGEAAVTRDIPLGKIAPPQDVANVIAFLASGLAPHATGTTIDINGASYVH
ncbi:SDR family NAD(P)-dependent oxidoreductase [Gloeocapsopsis dulcis]|uniref:3-oxoacyl-ACP reductase n=1 Tax=Gloeocapsopsis dulcis AAB1 = 1H9 TaxID=1433147 RepID=A0A6N8FVW1_9CHRO|nr:SDR family NAD(P)-dependent oxidoreductase [Gloeocapsopsis dulcis]MUL37260.1 3-oxoacyl-ACP reductase [Gloeocapsopsis dulcis AAB1 = 1H9]WNN91066.1 SDR family oxidoreductase [Gloeocapsopsis dulcis]